MSFFLERSEYSARQLIPQDADILQALYADCKAFFLPTGGLVLYPTAAWDEFKDLPTGKGTEDVFIFGLFDADNGLLRMISAVRHYPDLQT